MNKRTALLASLALALALPTTPAAAQSTVGEPPGAPRDVVIESDRGGSSTITWNRSTDDTGIREYRLYSNGVLVQTVGPDARRLPLDLPDGVRFVQLDAVDLDGNESVKTSPIQLLIDNTPPPAPINVTAEASYISATTRVLIRFDLPNRDDVSFCTLIRTLRASVTGNFDPTPDPDNPGSYLVVEWNPPPGDAWFQISCEDGNRNASVRSAPAFVNILDF